MSDQHDPATVVSEVLSRTTVPSSESDVLGTDAISAIDVHDGTVTVVIDDEEPSETDWPVLRQTVQDTVADLDFVESVDVKRATAGPDITGSVDAFDRVIAVASAKGGVGKSTVATHLAATLARTEDVAIFDADVHGPNVPRLFDIEGPVYSTDEGQPIPIENDGLEVMSVGLLESEVPLAWRGAMVHDAISQLFAETAWRSSDTLVIDLPPGTGDVVLTTLQEVPVDGLVVVTTPFHTSVTDTNRTVELFRDEGVPVVGAVVNMAEFTCECCGEPNTLFADAVADLETPVLAELPFDDTLQGQPVPGQGPEAIEVVAERIESELDALGSYTPPRDALDIRGLPPATRRQRVRQVFTDLDAGEEFELVSDRDPTPVREFLASMTDTDSETIEDFDVERKTPDTWLLTTKRP